MRKKLQKALLRQEHADRKARDEALRQDTGIQRLRAAPVFATPLPPLPRPGTDAGRWWPRLPASSPSTPTEASTEAAFGSSLSPRGAGGEGQGEGGAADRGASVTPTRREVLVGNRALLAERGVAVPPAAGARAAAAEARGETVAFLAVDGALAALLSVADAVREEAPEAVAALRALGLAVSIVSGDGEVTTRAVAARLGLGTVAEATPVEKREIVAELQARGRRVLFVGDGLNDAPALTQAEVGVAMGRGTDVTLESADAVLVRDDLRLVPDLVRRSRRAYGVIRQNVFWAFYYNAVAIPVAMAGLLHPIVAAAAMAASSIFVVANSLRLARER
jgi:Cu2+-exporting ATPase